MDKYGHNLPHHVASRKYFPRQQQQQQHGGPRRPHARPDLATPYKPPYKRFPLANQHQSCKPPVSSSLSLISDSGSKSKQGYFTTSCLQPSVASTSDSTFNPKKRSLSPSNILVLPIKSLKTFDSAPSRPKENQSSTSQPSITYEQLFQNLEINKNESNPPSAD